MPGINTKGRYALISGKWPTKPSEIVVTPSLRQGIGGKNKLVLEPGNYDLTIVGTVGATFDKSSREILARSGTWQAWPLTQKQAKISGLSGNYLIFFTSSDSAGTCSKVNDDLGSDPLESDACTTREQLLSKEFAPLSGKKIVEQYLAWFLVAGLGGGFGCCGRHNVGAPNHRTSYCHGRAASQTSSVAASRHIVHEHGYCGSKPCYW